MNIRYYFFILFLIPLLVSCDPSTTNLDMKGMFSGQSPRVNQRFADSEIWNAEHGYPIVHSASDVYRVYIASDSHIDTTRTNLLDFVHSYRSDAACPLAIHLGDHINAQNHWQFMYETYTMVRPVAGKVDTLLTVAGNHDLYFEQWTEYLRYFHTSTYYFEVQTPSGIRDLYVMLDTGDGQLGTDQMAWLRRVLAWADKESFRHRIICSHTNLFYREGLRLTMTSTMPMEEVYELISLFTTHHVDMFWSGHRHVAEQLEMNGVVYIVAPALMDTDSNAGYLIATIGDTISLETIPAATIL